MKRSGVVSKSGAPEKKISSDDTLLDRLLLAHSNLSSLLPQVDELVAQAFKRSLMTKKEKIEIERFVDVLSEIFSLLKPLVPRLHKVLSYPANESEDQVGNTLTNKASSFANEDVSFEVGSPEETKKLESLISPSPLVSWRADCMVERGKQLFLLTPLSISKTLSSKTCKPGTGKNKDLEASPKWSFSLPKSRLLLVPPYKDKTKEETRNFSMSEVGGAFAEASLVQSPPTEPSDSMVAARQKDLRSWAVNSPRMLHSKMSPPKSCVLLEPMYGCSHLLDGRVLRSTPFPVTAKNCSGFPESSGSESSEDLTLKYPELRGIQNTYRPGILKKELESSPEWLFSPPKTCVLLVPPNYDCTSDNIMVDNNLPVNSVWDQETDFPMLKMDAHKDSCRQENIRSSLAPIESTPMWKPAGSTVQRGKRPGESTLKKELWTMFEEASIGGLTHDTYACQRTARKGFIDMLDEVSSDEQSPVSTGKT